MSNNTVQFVINITGNAQENITAISQGVQAATSHVTSFTNTVTKIRDIGFAFETINRAVSGLTSKIAGYAQASYAQTEAETKLAQVMRNTMGASQAETQSILDLAAAQQKLGVIGDEVQLAGAQELGTYLTKADTLKKLMPVMNDMVAQQYGMNASQESAVNIATMMGKVMDGQVGALSRYGYKFDEAQEKILKFGTEEQRAATLAEVVSSAVGGVNEALAKTPEGAIKKVNDNIGDLQEEIGRLFINLKASFMPTVEKLLEIATNIVSFIEEHSVLFGAIVAGVTTVIVAIKGWIAVQGALNIIMSLNPIGLMIAGIVALVAAIVFLCVKIKGWGTLWQAVVTFARETFLAFVEAIKLKYTTMINGIMLGIDKLKQAWYSLKNLIGKGDEAENNRALKEISEDIERRKKAITGGAKEVAKHAKAAANAWKGVSLSWDKSKNLKSVTKDIQASLGLGVTDNTKTINNDLSTSSETISAGGKNIKNFNITIGSLIGENTNMFQSSQDNPETASDFMDKLSTALQMIVNDVNYAAE